LRERGRCPPLFLFDSVPPTFIFFTADLMPLSISKVPFPFFFFSSSHALSRLHDSCNQPKIVYSPLAFLLPTPISPRSPAIEMSVSPPLSVRIFAEKLSILSPILLLPFRPQARFRPLGIFSSLSFSKEIFSDPFSSSLHVLSLRLASLRLRISSVAPFFSLSSSF